METTVNQRIKKIVDLHYNGVIKEMAIDTGIRPSTLVDIVAGKSNPSYDTIFKILKADIVGINADWLIMGGGDVYAAPSEVGEPSAPYGSTNSELIDTVISQQKTIAGLVELLKGKE